MKFHKLYRNLAAAIFTFICCTTVHAWDSSKGHLSFEPFFSYQYGKIGEYLYVKDMPNQDYRKLSYLEWEEQPVWLYGLNMDARYSHLYLGLSFSSAIPYSCGKMHDSDWLNTNDHGMNTNYSVSNNSIHNYIDVSGKFGFMFRPEEKFRIMPMAEIGYYNLTFKAKGAEGWYGDASSTKLGYDVSWNSPYAEHFYISNSENVIEYNQYSLYTFLGCRLVLIPINRLEFDMDVAVSPYSYVVSIDKHLLRSIKFKDELDAYFKTFKGRISAYYIFNDIISAGLSLGGTYTLMELGKTAVSYGKAKYSNVANEKGGVDRQTFNATFSVRISVF